MHNSKRKEQNLHVYLDKVLGLCIKVLELRGQCGNVDNTIRGHDEDLKEGEGQGNKL